MVEIPITPEEREILLEFNNKYYSAPGFDRKFNPAEQKILETRYTGTLGEWAIWKKIGKTVKEYTEYKFANRTNLTDIILNGKRWDIKTKKPLASEMFR